MSHYVRYLKHALERAGQLRISWMKEKPGGPTIATVSGSGEHVTDATSEAFRAAHSLVRIGEAHDRVKRAREELAEAERELEQAFRDLDDDRSGA